ncbi:MAG: hypothetical protein ACYTF6_13070 [Planctomycetota bacterium]|jgi:hypothetical protein
MVTLLSVVAVCLLPPGLCALADASADTSAAEPAGGDLHAVVGQVTKDTYGLYLVDCQYRTICMYEWVPQRHKLRLMAARSYAFDRELDSDQTEPPSGETQSPTPRAAGAENVHVTTGQVTESTYGLYIVDAASGKICVYEWDAKTRKLHLKAGRDLSEDFSAAASRTEPNQQEQEPPASRRAPVEKGTPAGDSPVASLSAAAGGAKLRLLTGPVTKDSYGVYILDEESGKIGLYELREQPRELRLLASRSYLADRKLEEYNTELSPQEVKHLVGQQRTLSNSPEESAAPSARPQRLYAAVGQVTKDTYGLYMVDPEYATIVVYEWSPQAGKLRLMAARTYLFDRQLEDYNTELPPREVKKLVAEQKRLGDPAAGP